ncbi:MAG: putative glycosyltransferase [Parcubacteria group bacterium Gr01-1014_38]|nr:MAG: putative glycosyltransferase [Parcubacteria group bacterium Gr01-1014_38]
MSIPLDVIILAWNGQEVIGACLRSVRLLTSVSVTVVDNASTDRTPDLVREVSPAARLICNDQNVGFAAACNQAIRATRAPFCLLLNQDAVIVPEGIGALLSHLQHAPRCAAAGGRIENPDGSLQPSMGPFPHPVRVLLDRIPGARLLLPSHTYRHPWFYVGARQPAWLTGSCLLMRREAFDNVGPLDESYFLYTEDLEWCVRARKKGWTIQYLPVRTAIHADHGRRPDRAPQKAKLMRSGLQRYFRTHGTKADDRVFRFLLALERRFR